MKTSAQLKEGIDRGHAKDKVDFPDPAAAPLGTDDEAAGTPPTEAELKLAGEAEFTRPGDRSPHDTRERIRGPSGTSNIERGWSVAAEISIVVISVFAVAALLIYALS
ncbi:MULTISPECIES: hypothetical protein [unclassified Chelatococcus]|uniref:hypothetical protein n=1 Tax=unclassified Chelatococcus TaxID=2638111 RepID=UPI001BCAD356|nr:MULTISPECIES: hypothetical protein [unclassified Chelatococcus]CAH1658664.1 conserved hypothetical protein [Hyphomicrobiales bacterium]MBS7740828.1 hypothetical protein [Chelatococcus sp. HY11]MBX3545938.1 hypothetical protein [Chelatococcus sp.]MCO5079562.1 hypothetical protein [Chelatococcus sp.]CAH1684072.1 conserved hypothetical protein [Hyphomicrobiales bacterium]